MPIPGRAELEEQIALLEAIERQSASTRASLAEQLTAHIEDHTIEIRATEGLLARIAPPPAKQGLDDASASAPARMFSAGPASIPEFVIPAPARPKPPAPPRPYSPWRDWRWYWCGTTLLIILLGVTGVLPQCR